MEIFLFSYLYIVFFILAILVDGLPFFVIINKIVLLSKSSFQIIRSDAMEELEKQKLLLANSFGIFKQSLKMSVLILAVFAAGLLLLLLSGIFKKLSFPVLLDCIWSAAGALLSFTAFFSYFLIKKMYVKFRL